MEKAVRRHMQDFNNPVLMTQLVNTKDRFEQWQKLLAQKEDKKLLEVMQEAPRVEVAEFLSAQTLEEAVRLLEALPIEDRGEIFENWEEGYQMEIYQLLTPHELARIFKYMSSDMRVDFYQKLTGDQKVTLLPYLSKEVRQDVITLSIYARDTAGGIMSTDFVALPHGLTVQEALERVRKEAPSNKMIYYLYVVNKEMKMLGFVLLRDLVIADPATSISDMLHDTFVFAQVKEDRESVARKIEKYDLMALPVLNAHDQLVGIVSYDDAMDVIRKEQTEDMERFMGIVSDESKEDYLATSSLEHLQKRIKWLTGLFILSLGSSFILHSYESYLAILPILSLYLIAINDAGGNAGSQTAAVVIRAFSLKQISLNNWPYIFFKELKVALMSALCLFPLTFLEVFLFARLTTMKLPTEGPLILALVISLSVGLQVIMSTLLGAMLPFIMVFLKYDPALAVSAMITTLVDGIGLGIYFTVAFLLLSELSQSLAA